MADRLTGSVRVSDVTSAVRNCARARSGGAADYLPLLMLVGDARFTLLGEASHGTHEFYRERAEITKRLILELLRPRPLQFVQLHGGCARIPGQGRSGNARLR